MSDPKEFEAAQNSDDNDFVMECPPPDDSVAITQDPKEEKRNELIRLQKIRTKENASLNLILTSNRQLRKLLGLSHITTDLFHLIMDNVKLRDKEIVRLRRKLISTQSALAGNKRTLIPRLVSKASEVRRLRLNVQELKYLLKEAKHEPKQEKEHITSGLLQLKRDHGMGVVYPSCSEIPKQTSSAPFASQEVLDNVCCQSPKSCRSQESEKVKYIVYAEPGKVSSLKEEVQELQKVKEVQKVEDGSDKLKGRIAMPKSKKNESPDSPWSNKPLVMPFHMRPKP